MSDHSISRVSRQQQIEREQHSTAESSSTESACVVYETELYIFLNFTVAERAAKSTKINNPKTTGPKATIENDRSNGYNRERQVLKKKGGPWRKIYTYGGEYIAGLRPAINNVIRTDLTT